MPKIMQVRFASCLVSRYANTLHQTLECIERLLAIQRRTAVVHKDVTHEVQARSEEVLAPIQIARKDRNHARVQNHETRFTKFG